LIITSKIKLKLLRLNFFKNKKMRRNYFIEIISVIFRITLGIIFLYAAVGKIDNPEAFFKEISNYRLFPDFISQISAIILPWIELTIGLLLILGIRVKTTSAISFILLVVFTLMVISAWARGLNINCGCFSHRIEYVGLRKVIENLLMMGFSIFLFYVPASVLSLETFLRKEVQKETPNSEIPLHS
jgi:putative oxidoreductase